ncbi:SMI1/KNR4 family protein [Herbidospora cretacea]|uniref:SMI1/KNR4 family protein n=1 Tax=Herbidospora cretacea TaxID=28444 RepID=UPI00077419FF|nr:SMI1/KNR4 family protein [Herbidospora cretacea]
MLRPDAVRLGREAAHRLALLGRCEIRPGLTDAEFDQIETTFGFTFADDHRAFLAAGLPINGTRPEEGAVRKRPWPDWRDGDEDELRSRLTWPSEGILFAVEDGAWPASWGTRPEDGTAAAEVAAQRLATAPRLVPVYGHRFLPAGRGTYGGQVLSIWGDDIIGYGRDLPAWVRNEFRPNREEASAWERGVPIPFWDEFI